ncbi:MAG: hypothetical protein PVI90_05460, partial [Desulfobacteraceae bacterium]
VWTDQFSRYLHDYVANDLQCRLEDTSNTPEIYVGDVIRAALQDQWQVETVFFDGGAYLDVGTPDDMIKAISNSSWTHGG